MIDKVIAHIDSTKDNNVERLCDLLRIPSISTDPARKADVRRGAQWVHKFFTDCGIKSEIIDTPGHPCVIADSGPVDGDGPTLLVYGHYDVQPTDDESLWKSPPFDPTIRDGAIFARGAADDKGQVLAHMLATEAWMKVAERTPIRVKFLVEGEEEVGSVNLEKVLRDHGDRLACDYVVLSDTPKFDRATPAITYGTKGMVYKEIIVSGPKQSLHSGSFGGTLTNPANAVIAIVASLRDGDNRVTIPGFYDDVRPLSDEERKRIRALPFDEEKYLNSMGAPSLEGEKGYSTLERRWARPTLDVNGFVGGFIGEGASTVIPPKVTVKVSMRVVPDQNPRKVSETFDEAVRAATPKGVRVEIVTHAACGAYICPIDSAGVTAAAKAMELGFGTAPVYIREGGSLPILPLFKETLGAESVMMGLCMPDCNAHGPNEFFHIDDLHNGAKSSAYFLDLLGKAR